MSKRLSFQPLSGFCGRALQVQTQAHDLTMLTGTLICLKFQNLSQLACAVRELNAISVDANLPEGHISDKWWKDRFLD
jgi:hypothetical protein